MEQVDTVCTDIDKVDELQAVLDLNPSLETEWNANRMIKTESIPENQESSQSNCTDTVVETVVYSSDYNLNDSIVKTEENVDNAVIEESNVSLVTEVKEEIINNEAHIIEQPCVESTQTLENKEQGEESGEKESESKCHTDETIKEESAKSPIESERVDAVKDPDNLEKDDVCTVIDIDANDVTSAQCQVLLKSLGQNFETKDHSLDVADAELTKLVDENSEVMVLTVETVPINDSNESTEKNIVVTVREKDVVVSSSESDLLSLQGTGDKKAALVNEEFDIIDYSQESDGTIIEVISTEVVHSDTDETCMQQESKEIAESIDTNADCISSVTTELNVDTEVADYSNDTKHETVQKDVNSDKENGMEQVQINDSSKTEVCDSLDKSKVRKDIVQSKNLVSPMHIDKSKEDNVTMNEENKVCSVAKKRSVIQDIFDDWGDENVEDDNQSTPKVQDTVEIELKSLLDDAKTVQTITEETVVVVEEEITCTDKESNTDTENIVRVVKENKKTHVSNEQTDNQNVKKSVKPVSKEQIKLSIPQNLGKSPKSASDLSVLNQTSQPHVTPVVSRGRNLTSQIASPAEVTEALKERLREKQKIVEAPRGPDIFFVKKLTQRLSSKLAGGPVSSIPALIPLPNPVQSSTNNCERKAKGNADEETNKESSSDNKELLAILEGDVDPDWSNLKPPTLTEEGKSPTNIENDGHNTPPKLDPLVERELALKQLLELPVTPAKRNASRKKKTFKPAPNKASKEAEEKNVPKKGKEVINIELIREPAESPAKDAQSPKTDVPPAETEQHSPEKDPGITVQDVRLDESRSGRKRKPTEKAREHEQNTTKRQKVYKGKISMNKKQAQEENVTDDTNVTIENHVAKEKDLSVSTVNSDSNTAIKEVTSKQVTSKADPPLSKSENASPKRPKQNLTKKGSQQITKRQMVVKKLLRPNMSSNKKSLNLKSKLSTSPKKSTSKMVSKPQKRATETASGDVKPKKKIINEIDRLLQDEGVVNLLYDVEQPDKKRLIPITKSQAKVMDIQKVQRELKIRKKLVRNAVLRLRTSTSGVSKVSPRSKRTSVHVSDGRLEKKVGEQIPSAKTTNATVASDFIIPAKIRNAADASIIIRRHSSSSFSSASGSPRVSIDGPDKSEGAKVDEGGSHSLRSTKRRHSQDERTNVKKSKKKVVQKVDTGIALASTAEDKTISTMRPTKKMDQKRVDKNSKQFETTTVDETNSNSSKVTTRSNGTSTGKVTSKSKKSPKNKVTFAKTSEPDNVEESSKEADELSACLAEAATALSVCNAGNRSGNSTANRKNKVNANAAKTLESESNKTKPETRNQFSNKEINVRRHGNLVQLILTPSSSTKIRNALTLQVMQEFRETLSILKKDDECRVVLLTSTGTSFCEGLELSMILHSNKEERRLRAQELADSVKDFIKSLASFNKPIVAGVQGTAVGLGVTMLPLFDLVIASDKATFSTPYGKLGQIAEGAAVFTLSHILGSAITSELLLGGRTLTASEALRAGLVTRVLWPDRFQVELLPTLRAMSEQSSQSMEATKALLRHSLRKKLDAALESETYLLIQHWCSAECQTAIKAYMDGKVQ